MTDLAEHTGGVIHGKEVARSKATLQISSVYRPVSCYELLYIPYLLLLIRV